MFFTPIFLNTGMSLGMFPVTGKWIEHRLVYRAMNIYMRRGARGIEQFFLGLMPASVVNPEGYVVLPRARAI